MGKQGPPAIGALFIPFCWVGRFGSPTKIDKTEIFGHPYSNLLFIGGLRAGAPERPKTQFVRGLRGDPFQVGADGSGEGTPKEGLLGGSHLAF